MDLFSILVMGLKEAERLANDTKLSAPDRLAAKTLNDALKALRGTAFRFRDSAPPTTTPI